MSQTDINSSYSQNGPCKKIFTSKRGDTTTKSESSTLEVSLNGEIRRFGTVTPGYYLRQKTGTLPQNRFSYLENTVRRCFGSLTQVNDIFGNGNWVDTTVTTGILGPNAANGFTPSSLIIENTMNKARVKCKLKLKNQETNLAQFYAERAQTARLLATTVSSIGKSYAALRHGDFRAAATALGIQPPSSSGGYSKAWASNQSKAIASGWLQLQYGWRPLISDAFGLVKHLKNTFDVTGNVIRVEGRGVYTEDRSILSIDGNMRSINRLTVKVEASVRLYYKRSNATLSELTAFGITNPFYIAWELTKFSFVVDWLFQVGNFINQLDAGLGSTFIAGSETTYWKQVESVSRNCNGPYSGYSLWKESSMSSNEWISCSRSPVISFPVPSFPVVKDPASIEHMLNALALLKTHKVR